MLEYFRVDGQTLDSLDLKVSLLRQGVSVHPELYERLSGTCRVSPDPLQCNALLLPGDTVVHIADPGPAAPFQLVLGPDDAPCLTHRGNPVTTVSFPPRSDFYRQRTSRGVPFRGLAVLQGFDVLSFPYLWPCEFAKAGLACKFCHCGNMTQLQAAAGTFQEFSFTPQDVADVVDYAVNHAKGVRYVQVTGGSTKDAGGECHKTAEMLGAIRDVADLPAVGGELIVYTTPPSRPSDVDRLFAAGADRIACDIEIWDEALAPQICPGKTRFTGRRRHLDTLLYVAQKYGPNKACSAFVVGLESAESFLAAAEFLAPRGIVPIPSIWTPHGLPAAGTLAAPDLEYYRQVKIGLARIYDTYATEPPGAAGYNVCLCRDIWNHKAEIIHGDGGPKAAER